jgi:CDP-glycerol glycerophosphotransferase (TagB/SpsB family)
MDNLEVYNNKNIYLAPHSPITLALERYLLNYHIKVKGFIDKHKIGNNIFKIEDTSNLVFDYIFICSPNHFTAITKEYLHYLSKEKLVQVVLRSGKYSFYNDFFIEKRDFFYSPKTIEAKRNKIVFISKGFIGSNNKALYLYCIKNNIETTILTNNKQHIDELIQNNLPYAILDTKEADYEIALAKYIVFDQGNYTYLPELHPVQKTIQLWHGVGLKKMSKINHITYDYFISTSNWTNETNFKYIFQAKEFLNFGYPRNDIFFQKEENLDFLFCDKFILKTILKNKDKKIVLYTPTHREDNSELLIHFDSFNEKLKNLNVVFIIKLHPFTLEFYSKIEEKKYTNIFFHNAYGDVYPLLKYVDILVSDYSSIVYDFLLLNKPIIFYIYDIKNYIQNVSLLFNFNEYSPGFKVYSEEELLNSFYKKDTYMEKRALVRGKFFEIKKQLASKNILDKILS